MSEGNAKSEEVGDDESFVLGDSIDGSEAETGGEGTGEENDQGDASDDPELEAIKARVRDMEEEAEKLKQMQDEVEKQMSMSSSGQVALSLEEKMEVDARSIYVGNVDYSATADDLERHFHGCGSVNRVTILCDKFTGHPKGFAYIEFADKDSVQTATALDESLFKGRQIKVTAKRTNRPGVSTSNRGRGGRGRGRGFGFGGRGFGGFGYRPMRGRGRRGSWYSPY